MIQPETYQIREFGTLASSFDTTDMGGKFTRVVNALLRPRGAIKGIPRYVRLWAMFENETAATKIRSLPYSGYASGIGFDSAARAANKTCAIRVYRQGKNFLLFYDLTTSKARGLFYMGDDGTYTSGAYDFTAGTPTYDVLAVGLNAAARWYGKRMATMLKLSNNVDTPVCVQLNRTATPGKWRTAGSNVKPTAAVISQVVPGSSSNVQAYWTISAAGSTANGFLPNEATDRVYPFSAASTFTANISNDRITIAAGYTPALNDRVVVTSSTTIPAGLTTYTQYYVVQVSGQTCCLAATSGGAAINITSTGAGTHYIAKLLSPPVAANDTVILASAGTLPTGLAAQQYYVIDLDSVSFKLSDTSGGVAVTFSDNGTTPIQHTFANTTTSRRRGAASLTFTADSVNFKGAAGNSKIKVAITYSEYATAITSARTGTGSASDPYIYTLTTGPAAAASSNNAIVSYVAADTLAFGILTASTSASDATADTGTWAATFLASGSGTGVSEGLTNQTCSVYLRYFDSGNERIGYEGISSDKSNEIILDEATNADILVTITPTPAAEGGRFDLIRVYFQFGEGTEAIWNLVGSVANTSGTKTLQVGTATEIGQALYVDQNRPLPFKDVVMVNNQVWHGGNTTNSDLLYVSKPAVDDEIAPEGANAASPFLIALPQQTSATKVTAMDTDNYRLHVHTSQGVILLDPADPDENRHIPQVQVGALNPACLLKWENSKIYYLGADLQVYEFDGARYGKRNAAAATKDAIEYILSVADIDTITRTPDRISAWLDSRKEMLWFAVPNAAGDLVSFVYDFQHSGIVGQIEYPRPYAMTEMEPDRPERVFCDEDGNMFVMIATEQDDWGDSVTASDAFSSVPSGDAIPTAYAGFPTVVYGGARYLGGYQATIETGLIDLGRMPQFKAFIGLLWSTVANSRAFVDITLTNKAGLSVTRAYGDIATQGNQQTHKVAAMLAGEAVKVKLVVTSTVSAAWIIRNMALLYRAGGQL